LKRRKENENENDESQSPPSKRQKHENDRSSTGLLNSETVKELSQKKIQERKQFLADSDPNMLGKDAETVYRDRRGRRLETLEALLDQEKMKMNQKQKEDRPKLEWGKGLVQKVESEAQAQRLLDEATRPFARTKDDEEMNEMLAKQNRWGDPMADLLENNEEGLDIMAITKSLEKKKKKKDKKKGSSKKEHMSEKKLQRKERKEKRKEEKKEFRMLRKLDYEKKEKLMKKGVNPLNPNAKVYGGCMPENRFSIRPGFRWDGVDRSNHFEGDFFRNKARKVVLEQAAYRWSTQDM
jgi:pre-mRNA-splicing factor CWC26